MKRSVIFLLCALLALSLFGCGGTSEVPEATQSAEDAYITDAAPTEASVTYAAPSPILTAPNATEEQTAEPTEAPIEETAPEFIELNCLCVNSSRGREIDGGVTYHVETLYLADEESNGALSSSIGMSSFARTNELYEAYIDLMYAGNDPAYSEPVDPFFTLLSSLACVRRSDDRMISVLYATKLLRSDLNESYVDCLNVSSSDGRLLAISDVIANMDIFLACVNGELGAYGDFSISEEELDGLAWTMDHSCMTVYFNVKDGSFDEIASVCPSIALWYSAHPIMFVEEYLPEGTIHSAAFPMDMPYRVEIDGTMRELSVTHEKDAGGLETGALIVKLNGREFSFGDASVFGTVFDTPNYFMHTADGDFILVEGSEIYDEALPDTPVLHVFAIDGDEVVYQGTFHGGLREWGGENNTSEMWGSYRRLPTDPCTFDLNESGGRLFGIKTWRSFCMGASGMPEPVSNIYCVDGEQLFLLKTDITADKLNDAGEVVDSADIIAQMALQLISTDGESYCDMRCIETGIFVRLYIEDGGAVINGMNADELWVFVTEDVALG